MILKINDKDVKFSFGLYFLGRAMKKNDTDLKGLLVDIAKNPISDVVDLMYFSAKIEAEIDETKLDLTKREFLKFLEDNNEFNKNDGVINQWANGLQETVKGYFLPNNDTEETEVDTEKKN